jgi:hypothetical protein
MEAAMVQTMALVAPSRQGAKARPLHSIRVMVGNGTDTGYAQGVDGDEILRVLRALDAEAVDYALIRVATPKALYDLKKGTVRPLDHQDAAMLRQAFDLKDEGR